ncbi:unnamed protein product, partial [Prorocentrum cordatum]
HRQDLRVCVRLAADGHRAGAAPRRRLRRPPEEARAAGGGGRRAPPAPGALRGGVLPRAAHRAPRHPENVMVGRGKEPRSWQFQAPLDCKVIDFGLAALDGAARRGDISGTPAYMAPEVSAARTCNLSLG